MRRLALVALFTFALSVVAQERLQLSVDTIMRGPNLAGYTPRSVRWSRDSRQVYFDWKQHTDPVEENYETYVAGRDGKGLRKLTEEEAKHAPPVRGDWTRDRRLAVFADRGNVYLFDATAGRRPAPRPDRHHG
jgi:hypothetical protein